MVMGRPAMKIMLSLNSKSAPGLMIKVAPAVFEVFFLSYTCGTYHTHQRSVIDQAAVDFCLLRLYLQDTFGLP
jgi:hypothetical protein